MAAMVTQARPGLRERKKLRTRQTILEVATKLFKKQGFAETTVLQITEEAEVAASTFFKYFPAKVDIVFSPLDAVIESARERILDRPADEQAVDAVLSWIREDVAEVEAPYARVLRVIPRIIESDPGLQAEERLRMATFEDVLAEAFARDLAEPADGIRPRVMAVIAIAGLVSVWRSWMERHSSDADIDLEALVKVKADYLDKALHTGLVVIESLPVHSVE
jgi:AcrR family transcriptional regulator